MLCIELKNKRLIEVKVDIQYFVNCGYCVCSRKYSIPVKKVQYFPETLGRQTAISLDQGRQEVSLRQDKSTGGQSVKEQAAGTIKPGDQS